MYWSMTLKISKPGTFSHMKANDNENFPCALKVAPTVLQRLLLWAQLNLACSFAWLSKEKWQVEFRMHTWSLARTLDLHTRCVGFFGTLVQATFVQTQILRRVFLWDCNQRKWVLRGSPDALSRYYGSGMLVLTVRSKVISSERVARMGESWVFLSSSARCYFPSWTTRPHSEHNTWWETPSFH